MSNLASLERLAEILKPDIYEEAVKVIDEDILEKANEKTLLIMLNKFTALQTMFILRTDKKFNILSGSVRSGKTYVTLFKYGLKIIKSPKNSKWLIAAYTVSSLERNCLKLLEDFFGRENFHYSINTKRASLYGREIYLEGAPNESSKKQIQGLTLDGAYLDEAQNMTKSFVDMVVTRISKPGAFIYMTCNPEHPKHWLYLEYITNPDIQADLYYYLFLVTDNKFLPAEYIEMLKRKFTGVFYQRMVLGEWKASDGVVFPDFANNTEDYLIDSVDNSEIDYIIIGIDFGGNKSKTAMIATAFLKDRSKGLVVLDSKQMPGGKGEIKPEDVSDFAINFYSNLRSKYNSCRIPYLFCDSAEQYIINGMRAAFKRSRLPIKIGDALKIKIIDRIRFVSGLLGVGKLKLLKTCKPLINSLQELVWDEKSLNDVLLDNGTTDNDSWDAFSYTFERYVDIYK